MTKIPLSFYRQDDVVALSRALIGKYVFTRLPPEYVVTGGMIIETEAYGGIDDKASHAYKNRRTKRTETMFAAGGVTYIYLCYGLHHLLNIVTNQKNIPQAVLIRAIKPEVGLELMLQRRNQERLTPALTSGPGSVCQALGLDRTHNNFSLVEKTIWLEDRGVVIPAEAIQSTPRIGVDYAGEDAFRLWRFRLNTKSLK